MNSWSMSDLCLWVRTSFLFLTNLFCYLHNISGFLLGTRQTLLETKDGGNTWVPRSIPSAEDEDFNYRFNSISFMGKEGWIVGKPSILLYTSNAGESWERIPLSAQLPGDMVLIYIFFGSCTGRYKLLPSFEIEPQLNLIFLLVEIEPRLKPTMHTQSSYEHHVNWMGLKKG